MKIAILTLPPISNYGGLLQNFALQQALLKLEYTSITIDRRSKSSVFRLFLRKVKNQTYYRLKDKRYLLLSDKQKEYIYKEPSSFKEKYINITDPIFSTKSLQSKINELDTSSIIVGSDQVWRPPYNCNIYNYYLDFIKDNTDINKIAYAASFGVDYWEYSEKQTEKCSDLAKLFDSISVREKSGINLCSKYLGVNASHVLDPTMLLTKEDYLNIIDFEKVPQRNGLFTYLLDDNKTKRDFVKKVENHLQLNEFKNQPKAFSGNMSKNIQDYVVPSIEGWIKSFEQADFIITDSFHGTVFSIIFNKPFIAVVNKEKGASRFYSLLEIFDLQDRLVDENCVFNQKILDEEINYKEINTKIDILRKKGFVFLKSSINLI